METRLVSKVKGYEKELSFFVMRQTPRDLLNFLFSEGSQPAPGAKSNFVTPAGFFLVAGAKTPLLLDLPIILQVDALGLDTAGSVELGAKRSKMLCERATSPYIEGRIAGVRIPLLVDTGAMESIISRKLINAVGLEAEAVWYVSDKVRGAKGVAGGVDFVGKILAAVQLGAVEIKVKFKIVESHIFSPYSAASSMAILGVKILRDYEATLDFSNGRMEMGGAFFGFLSAEEIAKIDRAVSLEQLCRSVAHPAVLKAILARIVGRASGEPQVIKKSSPTFESKIRGDAALLDVLAAVGFEDQGETLVLEREDLLKVERCLDALK